jgi:hypothetical protein
MTEVTIDAERPGAGRPGERYARRGPTGRVRPCSGHRLTVDRWGGGEPVRQDSAAGPGGTPAWEAA